MNYFIGDMEKGAKKDAQKNLNIVKGMSVVKSLSNFASVSNMKIVNTYCKATPKMDMNKPKQQSTKKLTIF